MKIKILKKFVLRFQGIISIENEHIIIPKQTIYRKISKQINYIADKEQKIIEGTKEEIAEITDIWTFKKDVKSPNPNWLVSATSS